MIPDYKECGSNYMPELKPYIPPQKVLKVRDIQRLIRELSEEIRRECNKKEANRLIEMQAALKCTLRIVDIYTTNGKCVR